MKLKIRCLFSAAFREKDFRTKFDLAIPTLRPYDIFDSDSSNKNLFKFHNLIFDINFMPNFLSHGTLKIGILLSSSLPKNKLEAQIFKVFKSYNYSNESVKIFYFCGFNKLDIFSICDDTGNSISYKEFVAVSNLSKINSILFFVF